MGPRTASISSTALFLLLFCLGPAALAGEIFIVGPHGELYVVDGTPPFKAWPYRQQYLRHEKDAALLPQTYGDHAYSIQPDRIEIHPPHSAPTRVLRPLDSARATGFRMSEVARVHVDGHGGVVYELRPVPGESYPRFFNGGTLAKPVSEPRELLLSEGGRLVPMRKWIADSDGAIALGESGDLYRVKLDPESIAPELVREPGAPGLLDIAAGSILDSRAGAGTAGREARRRRGGRGREGQASGSYRSEGGRESLRDPLLHRPKGPPPHPRQRGGYPRDGRR